MPLYARLIPAKLDPTVVRAMTHPWAKGATTITTRVLHQYDNGNILAHAVNPEFPSTHVQIPANAFELVELFGDAVADPAPSPKPAAKKPWRNRP